MKIDLAEAFSAYPSGRTSDDGTFNGQRFRDEILVPALKDLAPGETIVVDIDGVRTFGSSFLEEAFAGLVRNRIVDPAEARSLIRIRTTKPHLEFFKDAITKLLNDAQPA